MNGHKSATINTITRPAVPAAGDIQRLSPGSGRRALVGAIFKKNILEFIRYPMNMFFSIVMPVIFFLPLHFLIRSFTSTGDSTGLEAWVGSTDFMAPVIATATVKATT